MTRDRSAKSVASAAEDGSRRSMTTIASEFTTEKFVAGVEEYRFPLSDEDSAPVLLNKCMAIGNRST